MKVKMLWRKMTVGMTVALMLAIAPGSPATAAEMTGEDVIAAQAEEAAWEDEIILPGDEALPETAEETVPEEAAQTEEIIPDETTDDETDNGTDHGIDEVLIEEPDGLIEDEIFTEDAEELAAGTGYSEFATAAEISAGAAVSLPTDEVRWYKFVVPKSAYYQCDISFTLPEGAELGSASVVYFNSDGMELNNAAYNVWKGGDSKHPGYIFLNSQETIYLSANGWAQGAESDGYPDVPGNFSFVISEAVGINPWDAHRNADEDYLKVWCYDREEYDVCPNATLMLTAGWTTYGNKQPVFKWESTPIKRGTDGEWVVDDSKPSAVLSSTTNQVTVKAPSAAGEAMWVDFTAWIDGDTEYGSFTITTSADAHQPVDWAETAAPTALAEGTRVRTCKLCGQVVESEQIPKLPAFIHMNVAANSTIPLKVKQATTKIKVTELQTGDRVTSWTSNNSKVAMVDANGKIQGKKKGTAVITVTTASGLTYSFKIKVQKPKVATKKIIIESPKKLTLKKKAKAKISAQLLPITTLDKISYATSDKKIATVSKGVITARSKGKATITVKAGKKTVKINVKVTK